MLLTSLGQTRSAKRPDHLLQTPDTFVRTMLPGMSRCAAIVHASPALGAGFAQYTAEMEKGGVLGPTDAQRFLYVLSGSASAGDKELQSHGFAFVPEGQTIRIEATSDTRLAVIEKRYHALPNINPPEFFTGNEFDVTAQPVSDDNLVMVRCLISDANGHDFAVNTMTYQPGGSLSLVEIHIMEHGLVMLDGGGIYRLNDSWYTVSAGDFIWMGPYCPQWFGALGKTPARYLIYKDANRHPL